MEFSTPYIKVIFLNCQEWFGSRYPEKTNTGKQLVDWPHASVSLLLLGMLAWGGPGERKETRREREREREAREQTVWGETELREQILQSRFRNTTHFLNLCLGVGISYFSQFFFKFVKNVFNNFYWFLEKINLHCFGTFLMHFIVLALFVVSKFCAKKSNLTWVSVFYLDVIFYYIRELCNI